MTRSRTQNTTLALAGKRALLVEDDDAFAALLAGVLRSEGLEVDVASSYDAALDAWARTPDVVLTDVRLGAGTRTGVELATELHRQDPSVPVIVMTAFGTMDMAIAAMHAGAHDFLPKPFEMEEIAVRVRRALEIRVLRTELRELREASGRGVSFEWMVGKSAAMQQVFALIERAAPSDASILIRGETGTGKELVARAIHNRSRRSGGRFVAVNCAAMPESLLESELFGHVKGAFTDARSTRAGLFLEASHGTLFLDEIGEMPVALQAKLLRALQERKVRPVGSDKELSFDARIVSATHRDIDEGVQAGSFRQDLLYRINVVEIEVPPLRARGTDILMLAEEMLVRAAEREGRQAPDIDPECARRLLDYPWPGNVRELANVIERCVALSRGPVVSTEDLPDKVKGHQTRQVIAGDGDSTEFVPLEEIERRYVMRVLEAVGGQRTRAAQVLGIDRKTLYHRLRTWGVDG